MVHLLPNRLIGILDDFSPFVSRLGLFPVDFPFCLCIYPRGACGAGWIDASGIMVRPPPALRLKR